MKVFVAGATGVVGKRLVPLLVASGYEVTGSTRSAKRETWLREVGATPVLVDALDRNAVMQACHAGGRGFKSRRSRLRTACKSSQAPHRRRTARHSIQRGSRKDRPVGMGRRRRTSSSSTTRL